MKGKTKIGIELSKTEMLVIGTEVEIIDILRYGCGILYMCITPSGIRIPIEFHKIDITDYTPFAERNYKNKAIEEAAKEYAESVIDSFGTNGVSNGVSDIKDMIALGFENGTSWLSSQIKSIILDDTLTDGEVIDNISELLLGITHWMPIPSFDEILEANKDVLERIKEKGD